MMARPNWQALRRSRNWCVGATTGMALFFAAWQFLVPASPRSASSDDSPAMSAWAWIVAFALSFPNALVLAVSAGRVLWRARRRSVAWVPVAVLLALGFGLPSLAGSSGFGMEVVLWSIPLALSISVGFSVCVILFTPTSNGPAPPTRDGLGNEEHAYSRDLVSARPPGEAPNGR
jgi:hypothetical protein